ncbi:M23 family metallopeptidase [Paenibacillus psychroresistens]|uniref:M23 family metallopeptidase n=1 Tax=Paenibacillus psychroresistens TaxID=1778678 RepID=A0A6B8RU73_9BACL|nr:M23 family metallopeptidase [Paenibacillus psychroresistens]
MTLLLFFFLNSLVYAEESSSFLKRYNISINDAIVEGEKLNIMEEEYFIVAQRVNNNTMLTAASDLSYIYGESKLASLDKEINLLISELNSTEALMNKSKEKEVKYIMELDSKYRSIVSNIENKRQARKVWMEQTKLNNTVPVKNADQDKSKMNALSNLVDEQRDKYHRAITYSDLGEITNFKSPLEIPVIVTSPFGVRMDPLTNSIMKFHKGLDMHAPLDTSVLAAFNGYVEEASQNSQIGNYVIIDHGNGIKTLYGHLNSYHVVKGQKVTQYEIIAKSGNSGTETTGPHLHFGVFINGNAVDPEVFINQINS